MTNEYPALVENTEEALPSPAMLTITVPREQLLLIAKMVPASSLLNNEAMDAATVFIHAIVKADAS